MTQQKKGSKKLPKPVKTPDLRDKFAKLPKNEQDAVINFFNLHNSAIWIFSNMSEEAKEYTNYCIALSQSAKNIEEKHKNEQTND